MRKIAGFCIFHRCQKNHLGLNPFLHYVQLIFAALELVCAIYLLVSGPRSPISIVANTFTVIAVCAISLTSPYAVLIWNQSSMTLVHPIIHRITLRRRMAKSSTDSEKKGILAFSAKRMLIAFPTTWFLSFIFGITEASEHSFCQNTRENRNASHAMTNCLIQECSFVIAYGNL